MRVADRRDARLAGQRLVQVHRPAPGHEEAVAHAEVGDEAQDVVGQLHATGCDGDETSAAATSTFASDRAVGSRRCLGIERDDLVVEAVSKEARDGRHRMEARDDDRTARQVFERLRQRDRQVADGPAGQVRVAVEHDLDRQLAQSTLREQSRAVTAGAVEDERASAIGRSRESRLDLRDRKRRCGDVATNRVAAVLKRHRRSGRPALAERREQSADAGQIGQLLAHDPREADARGERAQRRVTEEVDVLVAELAERLARATDVGVAAEEVRVRHFDDQRRAGLHAAGERLEQRDRVAQVFEHGQQRDAVERFEAVERVRVADIDLDAEQRARDRGRGRRRVEATDLERSATSERREIETDRAADVEHAGAGRQYATRERGGDVGPMQVARVERVDRARMVVLREVAVIAGQRRIVRRVRRVDHPAGAASHHRVAEVDPRDRGHAVVEQRPRSIGVADRTAAGRRMRRWWVRIPARSHRGRFGHEHDGLPTAHRTASGVRASRRVAPFRWYQSEVRAIASTSETRFVSPSSPRARDTSGT